MNNICPLCNGSGQFSTFKGVSRFLLTWEECPQCAGLGYLPEPAQKGQEKQGECEDRHGNRRPQSKDGV